MSTCAYVKQTHRIIHSSIQGYLLVIGIILIIIAFLTLFILTYSLYDLYQQTTTWKIESKLKFSTYYPTIACSFFICCSCCVFIQVVLELDPTTSENFSGNPNFVLLIIFWAVFLFLSKLSLYAQYLARLHTIFQGSALAVKKYILVISICLFVLSIAIIIWWIFLLVTTNVRQLELDSYDNQLIAVVSLLILIDFILAWMVVISFILKLYDFLLLKDRRKFLRESEKKLKLTESQDLSEEEQTELLNLQNQAIIKTKSLLLDIIAESIDIGDMKTLDLITKQSILSASSMIITQCCYLTLIIVIANESYFRTRYHWIYWVFGGVYYPMDVIINCIVLYFNYNFATQYYMCCCKLCHGFCKNCAKRCAAEKIFKQYYNKDLTKRPSANI
eukprot:287972_1